MEENTPTVPSPENLWAPSGVFVSNNETPSVQDTSSSVEAPVSQQTETSVVQEQPVTPVQIPSETAPVASKEGALDKIFTGLVRFIAKISGQPDPITWAVNTSQAVKKTENVVGKVWNAANQAVEKASSAAHKTVDTVSQATEKIQQVIPPPTAEQPAAPAPEQPPAPVTPPTPEQPAA